MVNFVTGEMNLLFWDKLFVFQFFLIEKSQALLLEKRLAKIGYKNIIDVWRIILHLHR